MPLNHDGYLYDLSWEKEFIFFLQLWGELFHPVHTARKRQPQHGLALADWNRTLYNSKAAMKWQRD